MYDDIGVKLKGFAKGIFIVEAIGSFIAGVILMLNDSGDFGSIFEPGLLGVLIMIFGPIAAWVSSLFIYGFGELIDKACEIAENTSPKSESVPTAEPENEVQAPNMLKENWPCPNCGKTIETDTCGFCGYTETHNNAPYWCGRCGHNGPYEDICPNCNSNMKIFNVHYKK